MSKDYLVGYTGFVGSNLAEQHIFDGLYNSVNQKEAYGGNPDILVYSGVRSEMYLANQDPAADYRHIEDAMENIRLICPKQVVLISTIAVYSDPIGVDEDSPIHRDSLTAYGANRRALEEWVESQYDQHLIIRLPALYGKNLKKNFIYDYIHYIPALLTKEKFLELHTQESTLHQYYSPQDNGFYKCRVLSQSERKRLKSVFRALGFSALNFTDSRSRYQFYNLKNLWRDIETALQSDIRILNLATPPVSVSELYNALSGKIFDNQLQKPPFNYDMHTKYAKVMGGDGVYLMSKEDELREVKEFIERQIMEIEAE